MEFVTVDLANGEVLTLGTFHSHKWDAEVGPSGNLIIETPKGITCFARGQWHGFHASRD